MLFLRETRSHVWMAGQQAMVSSHRPCILLILVSSQTLSPPCSPSCYDTLWVTTKALCTQDKHCTAALCHQWPPSPLTNLGGEGEFPESSKRAILPYVSKSSKYSSRSFREIPPLCELIQTNFNTNPQLLVVSTLELVGHLCELQWEVSEALPATGSVGTVWKQPQTVQEWMSVPVP